MEVKIIDLPVYIRPMEDEDLPFVLANWMDSHYPNTELSRHDASKNLWKAGYAKVIRHILKNSSTVIMVNSENPMQLIGFCCAEIVSAEKITIHYLFVKQRMRRLGLGKALLDSFRTDLFAHKYLSHACHIMVRKKFNLLLNTNEVWNCLHRSYEKDTSNEG